MDPELADWVNAVKWPAVVLIVVVVAVFAFRAAVNQFLGRASTLQWGDRRIETGQVPDQQASGEIRHRNLTWAETNENQLVVETREILRKEVETRHPGAPGKEREEFLLGALADFRLQIDFLTTYRAIYSGQLAALSFLNSFRAGVDPDALEQFLEDTRKKQGAEVHFDTWLAFLIDAVLVRYEDDGKLRITVRGVEFLGFLTRSGLPISFKP